MTTTDLVFQHALSNMLTEIFDGPPGQEAYVLTLVIPACFASSTRSTQARRRSGPCQEKRPSRHTSITFISACRC
jgi:hypothetical protein